MPSSLVNFNVPLLVRKRFDAVCHANGRSRTSVLLELMQNYVIAESQRLAEREKLLSGVDGLLQVSKGLRGSCDETYICHRAHHSPQPTWGDKEFDLPDPIFSDGHGDW